MPWRRSVVGEAVTVYGACHGRAGRAYSNSTAGTAVARPPNPLLHLSEVPLFFPGRGGGLTFRPALLRSLRGLAHALLDQPLGTGRAVPAGRPEAPALHFVI